MTKDMRRVSGQCLCGDVRFSASGQLRDVLICHCSMCRRAGSLGVAFAACAPDELSVTSGAVTWFESSGEAARGFCARCGSQLFWKPSHGRHISFSAGALNQPSGLRVLRHIHCGGIADYERLPPLEPDEA